MIKVKRRWLFLAVEIGLAVCFFAWIITEVYFPGGTGVGANVRVENRIKIEGVNISGIFLSHPSMDDNRIEFKTPSQSIFGDVDSPRRVLLPDGTKVKIVAVCLSEDGKEYRGVRVIDGAYEGYTGSLPLDVIVPVRSEGWLTRAFNSKRAQIEEAKYKKEEERREIARREAEYQAQLDADRSAEQARLRAQEEKERQRQASIERALALRAERIRVEEERARAEMERTRLRQEELARQKAIEVAKAKRESEEAERLAKLKADQEAMDRAEALVQSRVESLMKIRGESRIAGKTETLTSRINLANKAGTFAPIQISDVKGRSIVPGVLGDSVINWSQLIAASRSAEGNAIYRRHKEGIVGIPSGTHAVILNYESIKGIDTLLTIVSDGVCVNEIVRILTCDAVPVTQDDRIPQIQGGTLQLLGKNGNKPFMLEGRAIAGEGHIKISKSFPVESGSKCRVLSVKENGCVVFANNANAMGKTMVFVPWTLVSRR